MDSRINLKKYLEKDFFSVHHSVSQSYTMNSFHMHNVYEIYFAATEGFRYFVNDKIYSVQKNDMFIFNNFDLHRVGISPDTYYERYVIVFNPNYITDMCTNITDLLKCFNKRSPDFCHRVQLSNQQAQTFLSLFRKAIQNIKAEQYGDDLYKKIALAELLIFINNLYSDNEHTSQMGHDHMYEKVKPIITYINENTTSELTLAHLANHFYISKYHLCKIFKAVSGFSVHEYIIYQRILKATGLLAKNYKVSEVCEMTGFKNNSHFITTFKKIVGISPKQYAINNVLTD